MNRTDYYFTLGQSHVHRLENVTWDKDAVVVVNAPNEGKAREFITSLIGNKWGFCYTEDNVSLKYYPRGVIKTYTI